jgi:hypothetical protein
MGEYAFRNIMTSEMKPGISEYPTASMTFHYGYAYLCWIARNAGQDK